MLTEFAGIACDLSTPRFWVVAPPHNRRMNESDSPPSLGRFLTISDTAEVLNVPVAQAYALVRSGELPAIRIGSSGHWRIERSVLESYIEAMYEEARRLSLWNQSEFASLPELFIGRSATNG